MRKQRAHIASLRFCFTPAVRVLANLSRPPIMKGTSWTRAAPFKEERHHRTPSESIGNNFTPSVQQPQDQGTQEEAKIALYPVSLCLSSLHSFAGREHLDVCACTFTCTALVHNQIAMKIRPRRGTSKRYHRLFMKICTPENNLLCGMHVSVMHVHMTCIISLT